jgi:hypothetical protein
MPANQFSCVPSDLLARKTTGRREVPPTRSGQELRGVRCVVTKPGAAARSIDRRWRLRSDTQ